MNNIIIFSDALSNLYGKLFFIHFRKLMTRIHNQNAFSVLNPQRKIPG